MAQISLRKLLGFMQTKKSRRSRTRLRFEALEQRLALSTLTVPSTTYPNIQSAVDAAFSGDTIKVKPGTYVEQVSVHNDVGHSRDNIKIVGSDQKSIIQAPAVMLEDPLHDKAILEVDGSQNVTIEKFTIQGPGGGGCDSIRYGIRVDNSGSANITDNHITAIHDIPAPGEQVSGCQNGNAIQIGRNFEGQTGSAVISHNTIDNYQKTGIVVDGIIGGPASSAMIDHNTIIGVGPTNDIAQNGIQISRGASVNAHHNQVSNNIYSPQTAASTGILIFQTGGASLDHNTVMNNDVGIYFSEVTGGVADRNDVSGSTFDGIALEDAANVQVNNNTTNNNGNGIGLYLNSTHNTISRNTINNNSGAGIYVESGSTGNTFSENKMKGNTPDAQDDTAGAGTAGTGNTWKKNKGTTSIPPGLVS
jgi:parallel beta-helix repeat protein